jgi:hypothetical protein
MGKTSEKTTLSKLHNDQMQTILDDESELPTLKARLTLIKDPDYSANLTVIEVKNNSLEIKSLELKIKTVESARMKYLLSNGDLLHKYNECEKATKTVHHNLTPTTLPIGQTATDKKFQYYRSLRSRIDSNYVHHSEDLVNEENFCYPCNLFRVCISEESLLACRKCGSQTTISIRSEKQSSTDPPAENKLYEYKRFTHFCDWLSNIQAKESIVIPDEIITIVQKEVTRERKNEKLDELTSDDIKRYLKKHKFNKLYDNIPQILYRITKILPPQMTPDMEHNLELMFMAIQEPYELFKEDRHNFTSYSYIIYKFCQLLGYTEFLTKNKLKLHKDEGKIYEHDQIWKKICQYMGGEECGWEFIKTHAY